MRYLWYLAGYAYSCLTVGVACSLYLGTAVLAYSVLYLGSGPLWSFLAITVYM